MTSIQYTPKELQVNFCHLSTNYSARLVRDGVSRYFVRMNGAPYALLAKEELIKQTYEILRSISFGSVSNLEELQRRLSCVKGVSKIEKIQEIADVGTTTLGTEKLGIKSDEDAPFSSSSTSTSSPSIEFERKLRADSPELLSRDVTNFLNMDPKDLDSALSEIDVDQRDFQGLRLIHYAVLFNNQPLIAALRKQKATEEAASITIYDKPIKSRKISDIPLKPNLSGDFSPQEFKEKFTQLYILYILNQRMELFFAQAPFSDSPLGLVGNQFLETESEELVNSIKDINVRFPMGEYAFDPGCSLLGSTLLRLEMHFSGNSGDETCRIAKAFIQRGASLLEKVHTTQGSQNDLMTLYEICKKLPVGDPHSRRTELIKDLQATAESFMGKGAE